MSIVVLPFNNLSADPEQRYFADGLVDDLTTDLSRIDGMFVISRNTAFTYKGAAVRARQISQELSVRYVLEGSVRRSGSRVRVNAQLVDAETDVHLWAERFDGDTSDLFALQDEITSRIAVALNLDLVAAEAAAPTEHPDALDYILRGRAARLKSPSRESRAEEIDLYERALALDPQSAEAKSRLAIALTARVLDNMTGTASADIARAEELAGQVLVASPRSPFAHFAKAQVLRAQGQYDEAIPEYETVLAVDRNWVTAYAHIGQCKLFAGSIGEVIPLVEQAVRLSPRDPEIGVFYYRLGLVHLLQSRTEEAKAWLQKARNAIPAHPQFRTTLAAAYALKGETERAAAELGEALRLSAEDRYSSIARLKASGLTGSGSWGVPEVRELFEATYFTGLRKAGMPEE